RSQGRLNIVHDRQEQGVEVAEQRSGKRAQDPGMNEARAGTEEEATRGNEFLQGHDIRQGRFVIRVASIADSSLSQLGGIPSKNASLLLRGFWVENVHAIVQAAMNESLTIGSH